MEILESLSVSVEAVAPFLIYLGLGYFAVRARLTDRDFMQRLNQFVFKLIFPFMTFSSVYGAGADTVPSLGLLLFTGLGVLILEGLLLLIVPLAVKEDRRRGVVIQGIFRSNFALYGIPMTEFVFKDTPGVSGIAGIVLLEVVSIFNITSVIILEYYNEESGGVDLRRLPLKLLKNPLLQGCVVGLIFFAFGWHLPAALEKPVKTLGSVATPVAMITLGGTLSFDALRKNRRIIGGVLGVRLLFLPLVTVPLAWLLGLRGPELFLVLMVFGTPIATSSYPMAANMGGDGELAGQLVFTSTVVSLVTIFGFIFAMSQLGLIG